LQDFQKMRESCQLFGKDLYSHLSKGFEFHLLCEVADWNFQDTKRIFCQNRKKF
jgi:hypothetical protein